MRTRGLTIATVTAVSALVMAAGAWAGFAGTGYVKYNLGGSESATAVLVQKDGRIVLVGSTSAGPTFDIAVMRLDAAGDPDNSFSGDGENVIDIAGESDNSAEAALQRNGRIVIGGTTEVDDVDHFFVMRLTKAGKPDATFSQDGIVITKFGSRASDINDLVLQDDGRILALGTVDGDPVLARYRADGRLDRTFSKDGRLTVKTKGQASGDALDLTRDGRIVIGGTTCIGAGMCPQAYLYLNRLMPSGRLDRSFSRDGALRFRFPEFAGGIDLAVQPDGRIVVATNARSGVTRFKVIRLLGNGRRDRTFSKDGLQDVGFPDGAGSTNLMLTRDGGAIVIGTTQGGTSIDMAVARLTARGKLDRGFDGDGRRTIDLGAASGDAAADVAPAANGRIVISGLAGPLQDMAAVRLRKNGALDS